jgi:hypothetical protein
MTVPKEPGRFEVGGMTSSLETWNAFGSSGIWFSPGLRPGQYTPGGVWKKSKIIFKIISDIWFNVELMYKIK